MKQDYRFGQLCSLQANLNRDRKKKSQPYKMEDFAMRPKIRGQDNQSKIRANLDALATSKPRKKKRQ